MFTDIQIARRSALSLSKTLMGPTVVIAVGPQYAVIRPMSSIPRTSSSTSSIRSPESGRGPLPLPVRGYIGVSAG